MHDTITFSPCSHAKMMTHAARHPRNTVNGILLGKYEANKLVITDVTPVCHSIPTKPLLDMALRLSEAYCVSNESNCEIVGWYTAPEKNVDDGPGPVALKIVSSMAAVGGGGKSASEEPVLVTITNSRLESFYDEDQTSESDQMGFIVSGKDNATNHWSKQYEAKNILISEGSWKSSNGAAVEISLDDSLEFNDFEDHLSGDIDTVKGRDWLKNESIVKSVSKLLAQ